MGAQVVMGAMLQCSFGLAPSSLVVLPQNNVMAMVPAANILDNKPIANIPPFHVAAVVQPGSHALGELHGRDTCAVLV